jgi:hypothetical protein
MPTQLSQPAPQTDRTSRTIDLPLKFLTFFHAPWMWLGFSAMVWVLDYLSGPFVHLSILFVFPVAAAAWHRGLKFALPLALVLPWFRLLFYSTWDAPWTWVDTGASCLVRAVVLAAFGIITRHLRRQADAIRLLRGLLPIRGYCKKIRDSRGTWHPTRITLPAKPRSGSRTASTRIA